jgi:hypothetical protein
MSQGQAAICEACAGGRLPERTDNPAIPDDPVCAA